MSPHESDRIDGQPDLRRSWWTRATGPSLLSVPTVAIYFGIGILPIVATIPDADITSRERLPWLGVAVMAQLGLSIVTLLGGWCIGQRDSIGARILRVSVVAVGGALRGLIVQMSASALGLEDPTTFATRLLNSATTVLLWMVVLSILVDGHREFRRLYREAFERDVAITARTMDATVLDEIAVGVDEQVRRVSVPVRQRIDRIRRAETEADHAAEAAQQAADSIRDLVATQLRPLSHRLWFGAAGQPPSVRLGPAAAEALSRAPLLTPVVLALAVIGMIIGSAVRYGWAVAAVSGAVLILMSWAYSRLTQLPTARNHMRAWNVLTVPAFAVAAALAATQASQVLLGAGSDGPTIITIIVGIPAFGLVVAMARVTTDDRQALLEAMADPQAVRAAVMRVRQAEVAAYVHNHVQSQLTASALQMREAVHAADPERVRAAAETALDTLSQPIARGIRLRRQSPDERLCEVVTSWEGIAAVTLDLPPDLPGPCVLVIADVLSEAIANAVRSGGASRVAVTGDLQGNDIELVIVDNGVASASPVRGDAGLGTAWLRSLDPDGFHREISDDGATLRVSVPLVGRD